jgi:hypothetical protein
VSSVTYGSKTLTQLNSAQVTSSNDCRGRVELYYLLEADMPGTGSFNVAVTATGWCSALAAGAISLTGVAQQAAEASNTNANDGQASISTNITTSTDGAWLVDVVHNGNSGSFTANSSQTERYDRNTSTSEIAGSTRLVASAGNVSLGWTNSNANRLAHAVAAFAPATGCTMGGGGGGNLVMVTGDGAYSSGVDDGTKKTLFESWGWTVTAIDDNTADYSTAAANNDVMYISESVGSYTVGDKATYLDIGVVVEENLIDDDMEFISSVDRHDVGGTQIDIVDNSHYITSPFSTGLLTIYTSSDNNYENWATVASGAEVLAEGVGTNFSAVMAFDTGATLADLSSAVNRRVALTNFHQSDPTKWTNDAKTLIMRALTWASGIESGNLVTLELTLSSEQGGTVSMRTKVFLRNVE